MKRYWVEFEGNELIPYGVKMGCGVTAFDQADAIDLIEKKVFQNRPLPKIIKITENADVSSLDAGHVLPNMSSPNIRGIWFPLGYD